jgi:hypothetical protein
MLAELVYHVIGVDFRAAKSSPARDTSTGLRRVLGVTVRSLSPWSSAADRARYLSGGGPVTGGWSATPRALTFRRRPTAGGWEYLSRLLPE